VKACNQVEHENHPGQECWATAPGITMKTKDHMKIKHPATPVFIHIEYRCGENQTTLKGKYALGKLVSMTEFMVNRIDRIIADELPPPESATKPTILETEWNKFRSTINTSKE
jgi:hypothetical protein